MRISFAGEFVPLGGIVLVIRDKASYSNDHVSPPRVSEATVLSGLIVRETTYASVCVSFRMPQSYVNVVVLPSPRVALATLPQSDV